MDRKNSSDYRLWWQLCFLLATSHLVESSQLFPTIHLQNKSPSSKATYTWIFGSRCDVDDSMIKRLPWVTPIISSSQSSLQHKINKCRGGSSSTVSDLKSDLLDDDEKTTNATETTILQDSIYETNGDDDSLTFAASYPGDGSEADPDGIPTRFIKMQKGNREKAIKAFNATVAWREKYSVNTILSRPHPKFDLCRVCFPIYIPGRDLSNNLVVVQRPGKINFELAHENNITMDDVLMHYVYMVEYCWNILNPGPPDGAMTTIIDMKGLGFSIFSNSETREFGLRFVRLMSENYPQRSYKTLVINAPRWFNIAFKAVKPLLRESTRKKIYVYNNGVAQDEGLKEVLGVDSLPDELLHDAEDDVNMMPSDETHEVVAKPGPNSLIEREMRLFCKRILEKSGTSMQAFA